MTEKGKPPIKKRKFGGITLNTWQNEKDGKTWLNYTFDRRYKDKDGEFKTTQSMKITDLVKIKALINDELQSQITEPGTKNTEEENGEE